MSKDEITKVIKQIPIVAFALALIGISINMFLGPHHVETVVRLTRKK